MNEKVRIYHHGLHSPFSILHSPFCKRSSITMLETETGIRRGHDDCAKALEENVAKHLISPANFCPAAQELLLNEDEISFIEPDND